MIASSGQLIDYVYVTVENTNEIDLAESNFLLNFDDHYFADTKLEIDSMI